MTFSDETSFVEPAKKMMLESREAVVNYMMPLGLHHLFAWEHHYGPEPWCDIPNARADWMPKYYHKADTTGLGFDRSMALLRLKTKRWGALSPSVFRFIPNI